MQVAWTLGKAAEALYKVRGPRSADRALPPCCLGLPRFPARLPRRDM